MSDADNNTAAFAYCATTTESIGKAPMGYDADRPIWHRGDGSPFHVNEMGPVGNKDKAYIAYGCRKPDLVELACAHGVPKPGNGSPEPVVGPKPTKPIAFIENKWVDIERIEQLLTPSRDQNHHANGGPVSRLLERAVEVLATLPDSRQVVAVNNGTSALHLACGVHALLANKSSFRWVTSAFNFFSCHVGPLADTHLIDCDDQGRFSLDELKKVPLNTYEGVIYTNIFAQQSDWDEVAEFCRSNGKAFVVDNATGLSDRPDSALSSHAPIETISAHHTKPWGYGEGGFVICSPEQADIVRKLTNFGIGLSAVAAFHASNYKISDWSAAAILDRLERFDHWAPAYFNQEHCYSQLLASHSLPVTQFGGAVSTKSPRAHFPLISERSVPLLKDNGPIIIKKYYPPIKNVGTKQFSNTENIYDRIFSLSNAPEMRLVPEEALVEQIQRLVTN